MKRLFAVTLFFVLGTSYAGGPCSKLPSNDMASWEKCIADWERKNNKNYMKTFDPQSYQTYLQALSIMNKGDLMEFNSKTFTSSDGCVTEGKLRAILGELLDSRGLDERPQAHLDDIRLDQLRSSNDWQSHADGATTAWEEHYSQDG